MNFNGYDVVYDMYYSDSQFDLGNNFATISESFTLIQLSQPQHKFKFLNMIEVPKVANKNVTSSVELWDFTFC